MYRKLYTCFQGKTYDFSPFFGVLWSKSGSQDTLKRYDSSLEYVDNPFLLQQREVDDIANSNKSYGVRLYIRLLIFCCKYFYPLAFLLSHLRLRIYSNAAEACLVFRELAKGEQRLLCLPRSIFMATTSKRFKHHGAMYIGVFLPSRHMHAWVIEDGMHTDILDDCWIEYTPVSVMK